MRTARWWIGLLLLGTLTGCVRTRAASGHDAYAPARVVLEAAPGAPAATLYLRRVALVRGDGSFLPLASHGTPQRVAVSARASGRQRLIADAAVPTGGYAHARLRLVIDHATTERTVAGLPREQDLPELRGATVEAPVDARVPSVYGVTLTARLDPGEAGGPPALSVTSEENARVRLYQAAPEAGAVDVAWRGMRVATGLGFEEQGRYRAVPSGDGPLDVRRAGGTHGLGGATMRLPPGHDVTVVLVDDSAREAGDGVRALAYRDDNGAPPPGQARLRVLDVAAGAPAPLAVSITAPDDPPGAPDLAGLGFGRPRPPRAPYLTLASGSYRLRALSPGDRTVVADTATGALPLDAGGVYTALLIAAPRPGFVLLRGR